MMAATMLTNALPLLAQVETRSYSVLEFERMPTGWVSVGLLALLAALLYATGWLYRNEERRSASPGVRAILTVLRAGVVLMLACIWLEPVWATYVQRRFPSYTLVLTDRSASMGLVDRYRDPESAEQVRQFLEAQPGSGMSDSGAARIGLAEHLLHVDDDRFVKQLRERNDVRLFDFDAELRTGDETSLDAPAASGTADGPATDIGRAVRGAVDSVGGAEIAGIVLLSDGGINRGEPPETIAAFAATRNIPVFAVGIGDPADPINVRVVDADAPGAVFIKDPFEITAQLTGQTPEGESVQVVLFEADVQTGEAKRRLDAKTVQLSPGGEPTEVQFEQTAAAAGERRYRVEALPLAGEILTEDNAASVVVSVRDNKLRVLLVAGGPSWTYRYVTRLLERDSTVDLSVWLQSAGLDAVRDGNTVITRLPTEASDLFEYDAVLLLDPDPAGLPVGWDETLERLVSEHGGGVLYTAAKTFAPRLIRDPHAEQIIDLLPVEIGPDASLILNQMGLFQQTGWPLIVPPTAIDHPIMRQKGQRAATAQVWAALGGVYWHFPVSREKPVATVLARHGDPRMTNTHGRHVLIATQPVGLGRSAFIGFDGTWRWRSLDPKTFERFWIQLVRYLGEGKLLAGRSRVTLRTDHEEYTLGDAVTVSLRLLDEDYRPSTANSVDVAVLDERGPFQRVNLDAEPDRPGWFKGSYLAREIGTFRVTYEGGAWDEEPPVVTYTVSTPDIERQRLRLDAAALRTLASQSAGGRYVTLDEAMRIPEWIEDRHREQTIRTTPVPVWDKWWSFAVLVGLLGIEWTIRKRANLI